MIDHDRIRILRLTQRLTQASLGKVIGQDQAYISKIENGTLTGMTVAMLERLASALRVHPGTLLLWERGDDPPAFNDARQRPSVDFGTLARPVRYTADE